MDDASRSTEPQAYSANLDYTLKELQRKVQEHEEELRRVSWTQSSVCKANRYASIADG